MNIKASLKLLLVLALAGSAHAATFTVTTTADSGPGSLRAAIDQANSNPGSDTIAFAIPGVGPHVITLRSQLPDVTGDGTIVDGTTQPGYDGTPQVVLSGLSLGTDPISNYRPCGLVVRGNDCVISGLGFIGFAPQGQPYPESLWMMESSVGIRLHGRRNIVRHCVLGMSPDGMSLAFAGRNAENYFDIQIRGKACVVEEVTARNLTIIGGGADDNIVRSSRFGFRRDGNLFTAAEEAYIGNPMYHQPNKRYVLGMVQLYDGSRNIIGQPGAGNRMRSIDIFADRGDSITVAGNIVGAAADGTVPAAGQLGIRIWRAVRNTLIGGSAPGAGNVIYGRPPWTSYRCGIRGGNHGDRGHAHRR